MKVISIDTEFKNSQEKYLTPVCAVIVDYTHWSIPQSGNSVINQPTTKQYWLYQDTTAQNKFIAEIRQYIDDDYTIVAFYGVAEGRFLLSCGLTNQELLKIKLLDPFIAWKMLIMNYSKYKYGWMVIEDENGKFEEKIETHQPKDESEKDGLWVENDLGEKELVVNKKTKKMTASLANALFRILGIDINVTHKNVMRELILDNDTYTGREEEILNYCAEDAIYLVPLYSKLADIIKGYTKNQGFEIKQLSRWMLCNAIITTTGIPVNVEKLKNFSSHYENIKNELPERCNQTYKFFVWDERKKKYTRSYNSIASYIDTKYADTFPRTKTGQYSLKSDVLRKYKMDEALYALQHTGNILDSLKNIRPIAINKIEKNIGSDGRIRILLSEFGTISGRNTAKPSQGYLLTMSTFMRTLIEDDCYSIVGADYSAQEFGLQGAISGDQNLIQAYYSSDPYTWFAQQVGFIPNGVERMMGHYLLAGVPISKESDIKYNQTRGLFKSLCLGVGYGMGASKLAMSLTLARVNSLSGEEKDYISQLRIKGKTEEEIIKPYKIYGEKNLPGGINKKATAQYYLDVFNSTFPDYTRWKKEMVNNIETNHSIYTLPDNWFISYEHQSNTLPNFPVQGTAQVILREAVYQALLIGLEIFATLHDAIYIISKPGCEKTDMLLLKKIMVEAGRKYTGMELRVDASIYATDWLNGISDWTKDKGSSDFKIFYEKMNKPSIPDE